VEQMIRGKGPGDYLTRNNRFAAMLEQDAGKPSDIKSHTQGLAYLLNQGLAGWAMGKDDKERKEANAAITGAMKEDTITTPGEVDDMSAEGDEDYQPEDVTTADPNGRTLKERLTAALGGLKDNAYGQQYTMGMVPGMMAQEQAAATLKSKYAHEAGLLADKQKYDAGIKSQDREYAAGLESQKMQDAQIQRENERQQALDDAEMKQKRALDLYKYQQDNKAGAPKTVKTAEGVYILNPDGSLGTRLGGAKPETEINLGGGLKKGFRATEGGAEFIPGGSEDPATILGKREAERMAALKVKNLEKLPATRSQIYAAHQNAPAFESAITDAIKYAKSWSSSGIAQQAFGSIAGTDAFGLERSLDTIKANIGFGELLRIKEAGGTLGALSEMENRLLQAMQGALDPRMKGEKLVAALERVSKIQKLNLEQKKIEFKEMYPDSTRPWEVAPGQAPPPPTDRIIALKAELAQREALKRAQLGGTR
jgi:hypothetical protein